MALVAGGDDRSATVAALEPAEVLRDLPGGLFNGSATSIVS